VVQCFSDQLIVSEAQVIVLEAQFFPSSPKLGKAFCFQNARRFQHLTISISVRLLKRIRLTTHCLAREALYFLKLDVSGVCSSQEMILPRRPIPKHGLRTSAHLQTWPLIDARIWNLLSLLGMPFLYVTIFDGLNGPQMRAVVQHRAEYEERV
jgi:hypothetical protein